MKNQNECLSLMDEREPVYQQERSDGDLTLCSPLPFSIPPLPSPGSAVFAQAWTRQMIASLFSRQLALAYVAVANTFKGEIDFLPSDDCLALLLCLGPGMRGNIARLIEGFPLASAECNGQLTPPSRECFEGETS